MRDGKPDRKIKWMELIHKRRTGDRGLKAGDSIDRKGREKKPRKVV